MGNLAKLFKTLPSDFSGCILRYGKNGSFIQTDALQSMGIKPCTNCGHLHNLEQQICTKCGDFILTIKNDAP